MTRLLIIPALLLLAVGTIACRSTAQSAGGGGNGAERQAVAWLPIHEVILVGHIWHVEVATGSGTATEQWQVVNKIGRSEFIIEHLGADGYVTAYQVDSWAEAGKPNVKKAWAGKQGEEPQEIKVAATLSEAEEPGFVLRAKFHNVELAGKKFNGEVTTVRDQGQSTKTWVANEGWFNKVIRTDVDGKTVAKVVLARTSIRLTPFLAWPKQ